MRPLRDSGSAERSVRGLATLALLKTNFDAGHDHIEMFLPFVLDCVSELRDDDFSIEELRDEVVEKHGLNIPAATMATLLGRLTRRKAIRREGGRYIREPNRIKPVGIEAERRRIDREHMMLAERMQEFLGRHGRRTVSAQDALALLLSFVAEHQVQLLLDQMSTATVKDALSRRDEILVAQFIMDECLRDPTLADYLNRLIAGYVLQNTLFLKDIAETGRHFKQLSVFFDTGFLFGALGLLGEAVKIASREGLELLRSLGVRLAVFDKTIDEMKRVLSVYERHLATAEGRSTLIPTELTRYLVTKRYTPSDVRAAMALIEKNLRSLGLSVLATPNRDRRFTLDESALERDLAGVRGRPNEKRVIHDVDCVAAVLTLRQGNSANSLDHARAIFASASTKVVHTVQRWYKATANKGVPPIIHYIVLSNIAWLKKPASASKMKLNELVALCSAALRPNRATWEAFLQHLQRLQDEGSLTSDEAVAVVASELTDRLLTEVEVDALTEIEVENFASVVERVKASYRDEAQREIDRAKLETAAEVEAVRSEAEARIAAVTANAEQRVAESHRQLEAHQLRAAELSERQRQVELTLTGRANAHARFISRAIAVLIAVSLLVGLVATVPGVLEKIPAQLKVLALAGVVILGLVSIGTLLVGGHVIGWQRALEMRIAHRLRKQYLRRVGLPDEMVLN